MKIDHMIKFTECSLFISREWGGGGGGEAGKWEVWTKKFGIPENHSWWWGGGGGAKKVFCFVRGGVEKVLVHIT